jgi:hypothetical protein
MTEAASKLFQNIELLSRVPMFANLDTYHRSGVISAAWRYEALHPASDSDLLHSDNITIAASVSDKRLHPCSNNACPPRPRLLRAAGLRLHLGGLLLIELPQQQRLSA